LKGTPQALEGAKYICDQKIISLRKIDQSEIEKSISDFQKHIDELNKDIANIDNVVIRELDKLKEFYKERRLKVQENT
jgi:DNA gyrase/topoisomerase IV subunit A